jgi:hypothetical protein
VLGGVGFGAFAYLVLEAIQTAAVSRSRPGTPGAVGLTE